MALLVGLGTIHEALTAMEYREIVDEVDVAGLGLNLKLRGLRDGFNGVESLDLTRGQLGQRAGSRMSRASGKGGTAEVDDHPAVVMEKNGAAVETRSVRCQQG